MKDYFFLLELVHEEDIDALEYLYRGVQERYEREEENNPGDFEKYLSYYPVQLKTAQELAAGWLNRYPSSYTAHILLAACELSDALAKRGSLPQHLASVYSLKSLAAGMERASALLQKAVVLSSRPFHAWLYMGSLYAIDPRYGMGMKQTERHPWYGHALQLEPSSLTLRIAMMEVLQKTQAFCEMEELISGNELRAVYHLHYARYLWHEKKDPQEAEQHYEEAYRCCAPRSAAALAEFYRQMNRAGKTAFYFREAIAHEPLNAALLYEYAAWLSKRGMRARALACFRKAARLGYPAAWVRLGDAYREGVNGTAQHILKALSFYQMAWNEGNMEAGEQLVNIYWEGDETESALRNRRKAMSLLAEMAMGGSGWACARLAELHLDVRLVDPDHDRATYYLTLGMRYGSMHCYYLLGKRIYEGKLLCRGKGMAPVNYIPTRDDRRMALDYLMQSASLGYVKAMACLARYYDKGHEENRNAAAAAEWYCKTADHDIRDEEGCCFTAFQAVFYGEHIPRNPAAAARYLQQGAAVNGSDCQHRLAYELLKGSFAYDATGRLQPHKGAVNERNRQTALRLYEKAAAAGHLEAMYYLAAYYKQHASRREDHLKAFRYFLQAAEAGKNSAQKEVGRYYLNGLAVEKNEIHALFWLSMAADSGEPAARRLLDLMEKA
jgi:TPR repeat protein